MFFRVASQLDVQICLNVVLLHLFVIGIIQRAKGYLKMPNPPKVIFHSFLCRRHRGLGDRWLDSCETKMSHPQPPSSVNVSKFDEDDMWLRAAG